MSRLKRFGWFCLAVSLIAMALGFIALESAKRTPRELAPFVLKRSSGHNPTIVGVGRWLAQTLLELDRGKPSSFDVPALNIGAQPMSLSAAPLGRQLLVNSPDKVKQAIANAQPGDVISLLPGQYDFLGMPYLALAKAGKAEQPITLRAEQPGTVFLRFSMAEGVYVSAPYWTIENLHIQGVCAAQASCEHAFHIVGQAHHFIARNNTILDFNAHFKINMEHGFAPDAGLLENNTLSNTQARITDHPVTIIDLVGASNWTIRHNVISDFIKRGGDQISYGGFVKGAGADNQFIQNIVLCEQHLRSFPGQRVGLSLGGGGTGREYCRDKRCITEQDRGVIESNLIAACSDNGIYLNRAAMSQIRHNTLLETGGLLVRFPESSADIDGNLIDGAIIGRDDAVLRIGDNQASHMSSLYLGLHPVRQLFKASDNFNLRWNGTPPSMRSATVSSIDLCGTARGQQPVYGAFDNFSQCLRDVSK